MGRAVARLTSSLLLILAAGCGAVAAPGDGNGPLLVAVSIAPQAWMVEAIGGERVAILQLVSPGENAETYLPTDAQVSRLMKAAVYFRIGLPFENGAWLQAIAQHSAVPIVDTRRGIALRAMEPHGAQRATADHPDDDGRDPHIWLSPRLLRVQAQTIAETLVELDPAHADHYTARHQELDQRLTALDSALRQRLQPLAGRTFFVFHPSWGYFAADYGLHQEAIEQQGKEPTDEQLTRLQRMAREAGVRVVFVQPQTAGRGAAAVAQAIGGQQEILDPLARDVAANLERAADVLLAALAAPPGQALGKDSVKNRKPQHDRHRARSG